MSAAYRLSSARSRSRLIRRAAIAERIVTARRSRRVDALKLATMGLRLLHRQTVSNRPTGRAWIGSSRRKRPSSSARSCAAAYRLAGSFSRHLRVIVSRSGGTGVQPARRNRLGAHDLIQRVRHRLSRERRASRHQVIEHSPQRKYIAPPRSTWRRLPAPATCNSASQALGRSRSDPNPSSDAWRDRSRLHGDDRNDR